MRHRRCIVVALAAMTTLCLPGAAGAQRNAAAADDYIVVYRSMLSTPNRETDEHEREDGIRPRLRYSRALKGFAARLSAEQVRRLEADPDVAYVAPDRPVHATATFPLAGGEPTPPAGVRRIEAATTATVRGAATAGVAVIDTGIALTHPDLNAVSGTNCVTPGQPAEDDNGHGTHVAGSIAARNNGSGVVGVAPDTKLYAVKVLDGAGSGTQSGVICGIDWVTANAAALNIKVVNMSLGGGGPRLGTCASNTDPEHRAICNSIAAGVTYVVAAGNSGWDFDYAAAPDVPAAYPEVLTVSAVADSDGRPGALGTAPSCRTGERDDAYATFSNYAATSAGQGHTIAGPGVCIASTWLGNGYNTISGTSMATPHVAGSVALCLGEAGAAGPCAGLTPAQIVQRIRTDAANHAAADPGYGFAGDPTRPVSGRYFGHLVWDGVASSSPPPPPPPPPATRTASPSAVTVQSGARRSGTAANLAAADALYYAVNSTTSGTRTSAWYGSFTAVPRTLSALRLSYQGKNSRTCTQTVALLRIADSTWVTQDSRSVGTTEVAIAKAATGTAADYVSATGELRVRVRCTTSSGSFFASGNLLQISYTG